jgi:NADH-quinone oxidoreductase subunit L
MTFMGTHRSDLHHHHPHESPMEMTVPLIILAILAAGAGFLGIPELFKADSHWLSAFLEPVFKESTAILSESHGHVSHSTEWMLLALSVGLIIAMIVWAISKFSKYQLSEEPATGFEKVLENKWYVDELYDAVIVKPILGLGSFFGSVIEKSGIDKAVNGVGRLVQFGSRKFRLVQSGNVGNYVLMMVVSIILLIWMVFYLKY